LEFVRLASRRDSRSRPRWSCLLGRPDRGLCTLRRGVPGCLTRDRGGEWPAFLAFGYVEDTRKPAHSHRGRAAIHSIAPAIVGGHLARSRVGALGWCHIPLAHLRP